MKQKKTMKNINLSHDALCHDNICNPKTDRYTKFAKKLRSQYKAFEKGQTSTPAANEDYSSIEDELMKKFDELFGASSE